VATDRPEAIRSFVAVLPDDDTRRTLATIRSDLEGTVRGVRWVDPSLIHVTLHFFGDLEVGRIDPISERLAAAAETTGRFVCELRGLGTFGARGQFRVVWVGVGEGREPLAKVASAVHEAVKELGLPLDDRPFSPHLTVGRIRDRIDPSSVQSLSEWVEKAKGRSYGRFDAGALCLMRSELRPSGPVYTVTRSFPLGEGTR
jgi:2'-5' RNA ligase